MEKKPKIGVLPLYDTKQASKWNSIWIFPGYLNGILEASGMPLVLPLLEDEADIRALVNEFDGFLFTGGQDVDPALYNQEMTEYCNEVSPERDYMEAILFDEVRKQDKALFGVCRGLQFFNVALGGTLYQDLVAQKKDMEPIQHAQKTEFVFPVHDIEIKEGSKLFEIIGEKTIRVNSMHHQGIAELSPQLEATARAKDGLVEAVEIPDMTYGLAIQWHPEFLWPKRAYERDLFKAFVKAARKQA